MTARRAMPKPMNVDALLAMLPQRYVAEFPLAEMVEFPGNPKDHDLGMIDESMKTNGVYGAILLLDSPDHPHYILAGHGRKLTLRQCGATHGPALLVQCTMRTARRIVLVDNRSSEAGGFNLPALAEFIVEEAKLGEGLAGTGYDFDDANRLLDDLGSPFTLDAMTGGTQTNLDDGLTREAPAEFPIFTKDEIIDRAFAFYRERGFPYKRLPLHVQMQELNRLAMLTQEQAVKSVLGYGVADTYHPHRFRAHAQEKYSPLESFEHDARFRAALTKQLNFMGKIPDGYFGWLAIVQGTQACANFRPGYAMHLYRRFADEGACVLDPCTGYGGRLTGWLASNLGGLYIGCDPNVETYRGNLVLAQTLARPHQRMTLVNKPCEDALPLLDESSVDFAFTSPPYFAKELYSDDDTQSWVRYKTIDAWRDGFLRAMLAGCFHALRPGRACVINIADVKIKNTDYPLTRMTIESARAVGFAHEDTLRFEIGPHVGQGEQGDAIEPAFVFRKPDTTEF